MLPIMVGRGTTFPRLIMKQSRPFINNSSLSFLSRSCWVLVKSGRTKTRIPSGAVCLMVRSFLREPAVDSLTLRSLGQSGACGRPSLSVETISVNWSSWLQEFLANDMIPCGSSLLSGRPDMMRLSLRLSISLTSSVACLN